MEPSKMILLARLMPAFLLAFLMAAGTVEARWPAMYRVGNGRATWQPGTNLTLWASQHQFFVGDWLYFGFNRTLYNVLEVNKTGYDSCNGEGFITNITRGGRDVFNLTQPRPYYFICSRGSYCSLQGMKMEVNVVNEPPPPAPVVPLPVDSSSGSRRPPCRFTSAVLFLLVSVVLSSGALVARI